MNITVMKKIVLVPLTMGVLATCGLVTQSLVANQTVSASTVTSTNNIDLVVDQTGRNDGLWTKPYGQAGAEYLGSMQQYNGQTITANQIGTTVKQRDTTWRQVTINGQTGYVNANAFQDVKKGAVIDTDASKYQVTFNINHGAIWTKPYGVSGAEYVGQNNGDTKTYNVDKIAKVVYRGGVTQWVHLQGYGWVDRNCTRTQINMSEVNATLYGRYGILPREFNVFNVYGNQLNNAITSNADELYY